MPFRSCFSWERSRSPSGARYETRHAHLWMTGELQDGITSGEGVTIPPMMRRLRALFLLATLLATPSAMLASAFFNVSQCCCCDSKICPMHRPSQKNRGKAICGAPSDSAPTCSCSIKQAPLPPIIFAAYQATIEPAARLQAPVVGRSVRSSHHASLFSRSTAPPEHPPRS